MNMKKWLLGLLGLSAAGGGYWAWSKRKTDWLAASKGVRGTLPAGAVVKTKRLMDLNKERAWQVEQRLVNADGTVEYQANELVMTNGQPAPGVTGKKARLSPLDLTEIVQSPAALAVAAKMSGEEELRQYHLARHHQRKARRI
jgi:hypothetical protein